MSALTEEQQARMFEAMRDSQRVGAEERRENQFAEMVSRASCGRPRGCPNGEYPGEEPGNDARAEWAEAALQAFCVATGVDTTETAVGDLIADLAHWCDRHVYCDSGIPRRLNLKDLIDNGQMHYEAETRGKGEQFDAK